jgi:hypothetical protein
VYVESSASKRHDPGGRGSRVLFQHFFSESLMRRNSGVASGSVVVVKYSVVDGKKEIEAYCVAQMFLNGINLGTIWRSCRTQNAERRPQ